ncbi:ATP-dependent helicase, partial [Frankia sp. AgW1.1]|nr:ATP-dependent helicase [Frankia sp. AgW1.1]
AGAAAAAAGLAEEAGDGEAGELALELETGDVTALDTVATASLDGAVDGTDLPEQELDADGSPARRRRRRRGGRGRTRTGAATEGLDLIEADDDAEHAESA